MNEQDLFNYMQDEHGVLLLESDIDEIVRICNSVDQYFAFAKYLSENYDYEDNTDFGDVYTDIHGKMMTEKEIFNKWETLEITKTNE